MFWLIYLIDTLVLLIIFIMFQVGLGYGQFN